MGTINTTKNLFPKAKAHLVGCVFHYKNDIQHKLSVLHLYKT